MGCAQLCQRHAIDGNIEQVIAIIKQVYIGLYQAGTCRSMRNPV